MLLMYYCSTVCAENSVITLKPLINIYICFIFFNTENKILMSGHVKTSPEPQNPSDPRGLKLCKPNVPQNSH